MSTYCYTIHKLAWWIFTTTTPRAYAVLNTQGIKFIYYIYRSRSMHHMKSLQWQFFKKKERNWRNSNNNLRKWLIRLPFSSKCLHTFWFVKLNKQPDRSIVEGSAHALSTLVNWCMHCPQAHPLIRENVGRLHQSLRL